MKKIYLITIIILWSIKFYSQSNNSDTTYKSVVNQNYNGNVSETGINANQIIDRKLKEIDIENHKIKNPEGWDELLNEAQMKQEIEKKEQQKNDSIIKQLDYKSKLASIKKQENENFRNNMIDYSIGLIILIILIISIKKIYKISKGKLKNTKLYDLRKITKKEVLLMSLGIGIVISLTSGSLFRTIKYFKLFKGASVEVSKELSTFELHEFNYILAIECFIIFTGISYFYLSNKRKDTSS